MGEQGVKQHTCGQHFQYRHLDVEPHDAEQHLVPSVHMLVAAGGRRTAPFKTNGTVVACYRLVEHLVYVLVAAGRRSTTLLKSDGTAVAYGRLAARVEGRSRMLVATGDRHTALLRATALAWPGAASPRPSWANLRACRRWRSPHWPAQERRHRRGRLPPRRAHRGLATASQRRRGPGPCAGGAGARCMPCP